MTIDSIRQLHLEAKRKGLPVAGITVSSIDALFAEIGRLEAEVNAERARTASVVCSLEKLSESITVALQSART